jgi:hypothetical protein
MNYNATTMKRLIENDKALKAMSITYQKRFDTEAELLEWLFVTRVKDITYMERLYASNAVAEVA